MAKPKAGGARALRIPIKADKVSSRDVEEAIKEALASTQTDVFESNDALVIVLEKFRPTG
jgi:hypothetical protein